MTASLILLMATGFAYFESTQLDKFRERSIASEAQLIAATDLRATIRNQLLENLEALTVQHNSMSDSRLLEAKNVVEQKFIAYGKTLDQDRTTSLPHSKRSYETEMKEMRILRGAHQQISLLLDQSVAALELANKEKAWELYLTAKDIHFKKAFISTITEVIDNERQDLQDDSESVASSARTLRHTLLLFSVVSVAFTFFFSSFFALSMGRRFKALQQATLRVANGDYGRDISATGSDEFSELSGAFNEMFRHLREAHGTLVRYQTLVKTSPACIHEINPDGRLTSMNPAGLAMLGLKEEKQIKGLPYLDAVGQNDRKRVGELFQRALRGHSSDFEFETDTGLAFSSSFVPIKDNSGQVVNLMGITMNVTERRRAAAALVQSAKMASLGEMAAGIAHEINNPLSIILGLSSQLRRSIQSGNAVAEDCIGHLSRIDATTQRVAKIIKGLRTFSRNEKQDPMISADVRSIVEDTVELCRERFKIHGIDLRIDASLHQTIECRPAQVSQILMNLLGNAHDAVETFSEKWVSLEVDADIERVRFIVTDCGHGISGDVVEKIMQPFFTTKDPGKGTGLGLSISKGIAEDHHGRIYYDAGFKNTRFVLELPLKQPISPEELTRAA